MDPKRIENKPTSLKNSPSRRSSNKTITRHKQNRRVKGVHTLKLEGGGSCKSNSATAGGGGNTPPGATAGPTETTIKITVTTERIVL